MKKSTILALAALVLGVAASTAFAAKDRLIVADKYDATTMDPIGHNDFPSSRCCFELYDTLIFRDSDGTLVPGLAESWEFLSPTEYKFNLRKGVKFHNGEELKASDVRYTIMRATTDKGAKIKTYSQNVADVKVLDDYTVVIVLKKPDYSFFGSLTHSWGSIINEKATEAAGDSYGTPGSAPVGTGPFKFVEWQKSNKYVLERFDDFWGKKPSYKYLEVRAIPEPTNRTIELETKGIDIAYPIIGNDINRIRDNDQLTLYKEPQSSITYLGFNCTKAPFSDVRVRKAIRAALDTTLIHKAVWEKLAKVGMVPTTLVPIAITYSIGNEVPEHKQDLELAKKLLAEAGFPNGFNCEIWTNERKERIDMAQIMQAQLEEVGIKAEIKVLEWGAYLNGLQEKKHDMFELGWVSSVPDPNFAISGLLETNAGSNYTFSSDPKLDELLAKGRETPDGPERAEVYKQAQLEINDYCPMVFLHNDESVAGSQKNVKGFKPAGNETHSFRDVYFED